MTETKETLKSASETALRLGISKPTLCRLMQRGEINFYRIGVRPLFDEEKHIRPFLEGVEGKSRPAGKGTACDAA